MKQRILVFVMAAILVLAASPALAASTTAKASSTEKRIELQTSIAKKRADNTYRVINAAIQQLENIANRIESRIVKVETAGGVATESRVALAEARNYLSLAKTSIANFISLDLSGTDIRAKYDAVKAVATEAKGHLRNAHRALMKAVVSLKPGFRTPNATSTATTTSE